MGEVLCDGFNLAMIYIPVIEGDKTCICIVAIKDKKMGFFSCVGLLCLHHVILLNALLCSYELNILDACWIAVDVWSNSSRCRHDSVYLRRT